MASNGDPASRAGLRRYCGVTLSDRRTQLSVRTHASALVLFLTVAALAPAVSGAADKAPDGTSICPQRLHDRYQGWHPPYDRRHRCAFGHEHGSNPRAFRFFHRTGPPSFGRIGGFAGVEEAHPGFKVFVVNDDRKGLAWMVVLHQGSGSPKRGTVRFHSLEAWVFQRRTRRLVAHVRRMADFGEAVANCPGSELRPSMRLLPHPDCESVYERWDTQLEVGGVLSARPGFAIDNAITQFDPGQPDAVVFNKRFACGPNDPAGWDSYCKGDKRTLFHPRWVDRNSGRSRFRTDAYGSRAPAGLLQYVSHRARVDQADECCGVENAFVMERPSDGGIYRAGRGLNSRNFEFPGYCVIRAN